MLPILPDACPCTLCLVIFYFHVSKCDLIGAAQITIKQKKGLVQSQFEMNFGQEIVGVKEKREVNKAIITLSMLEVEVTAGRCKY